MTYSGKSLFAFQLCLAKDPTPNRYKQSIVPNWAIPFSFPSSIFTSKYGCSFVLFGSFVLYLQFPLSWKDFGQLLDDFSHSSGTTVITSMQSLISRNMSEVSKTQHDHKFLMCELVHAQTIGIGQSKRYDNRVSLWPLHQLCMFTWLQVPHSGSTAFVLFTWLRLRKRVDGNV
jgi:hypothetical protein